MPSSAPLPTWKFLRQAEGVFLGGLHDFTRVRPHRGHALRTTIQKQPIVTLMVSLIHAGLSVYEENTRDGLMSDT